MVKLSHRKMECDGWLMIELVTALSILTLAVLPLAYSFAAEKKLARSQYQRAVAMEIVDGELEVLASGEWKSFSPGSHPYKVACQSAVNLPPGEFTLKIDTVSVSLSWKPLAKSHGGTIMREAKIK